MVSHRSVTKNCIILSHSLRLNENTILRSRYRACAGFLKGGGPISLVSLKKRSSDFKRGVQWSDGGVQYISLTRTTNLAYLDAKE